LTQQNGINLALEVSSWIQKINGLKYKIVKRDENMMNNILTEEQMKVKENLDEKLQQEIEPQSKLEELDDYLIMLAEMSNIGIHRKILLLEGYINKVKNKLKKF
jgi:hypothetical protein